MEILPLSKAATSSALHVSELVVLLFGLLLVVGLIGEVSKSSRWKTKLRIFEVMVIVGVAGELIGDGGIFIFTEQLQAISDTDAARLNKEAGDARSEAAKAIERAARVEERAANLEKEAAVARRQEAKAERQLAEIRDPRTLPRDCLESALKGKPAGTVNVLYQPEDSEAYFFSFWIRLSLMQSGWAAPEGPVPIPANIGFDPMNERIPSVVRAAGMERGVAIAAKSIPLVPPLNPHSAVPEPPIIDRTTAFGALYGAFEKCAPPGGGIAAIGDNTLPDGVFRIIIGPKN